MKYIISFLGLVLFTTALMGQSNNSPYRIYSTQKVQERLLQENANMATQQAAIEQFIANYNLGAQTGEVTIPIVFHILFNEHEERIPIAQIMSQLNALNNSFNASLMDEVERHPADLVEDFEQHTPENIGIQFCLANILMGGRPINFIPTTTSEWGIDDAMKDNSLGGVAPFEPENYLNIWVCNLGNTSSGYAQMPGGPALTDGIVIDYRFFGTMGTVNPPYDLGKTLTHLVGSYLGLYELWNEQIPCGDDYVNDTPIHNAQNTGPTFIYDHISTCSGYPTEMTMNYMDNTDDAYVYMFTLGQMLRMQAILTSGGPRHQLSNSSTRCMQPAFQDLIAEERKKQFNADALNHEIEVTLSPNPANNEINLNIEGNSENFSFAIYSSIGRLLYQKEKMVLENQYSLSLDVKKWASGIYLLHVNNAQKSKTYRFAITHR